MGEIKYINDKGKEDTCFIDDKLLKGVEKIRERVNKKDFDQVFLVDGAEGSGKSVLAMQIGKAFDPSLSLERVCLTPNEFVKAIQTADKGQVVIYDEAYTGLAARHSLSEINKLIVSMMMEMRQKNLIVIIVLPTFFMLDKYVAIFRSKGLFHVYTNHGRRGYWIFYNTKKKKLLYIYGKKLMSYSKPSVKFKGNFYGKYVLNEDAYIKKKKDALNNREHTTKEDKSRKRLESLIKVLHYDKGMTHQSISELITNGGTPISTTTVWEICGKPPEK